MGLRLARLAMSMTGYLLGATECKNQLSLNGNEVAIVLELWTRMNMSPSMIVNDKGRFLREWDRRHTFTPISRRNLEGRFCHPK